MLSVAEALARITAAFAPLPGETVGLGEALGRVLAEDVAARVTQPPTDVSAMDGYAVRAADVAQVSGGGITNSVPARLEVVGRAPAGGAGLGIGADPGPSRTRSDTRSDIRPSGPPGMRLAARARPTKACGGTWRNPAPCAPSRIPGPRGPPRLFSAIPGSREKARLFVNHDFPAEAQAKSRDPGQLWRNPLEARYHRSRLALGVYHRALNNLSGPPPGSSPRASEAGMTWSAFANVGIDLLDLHPSIRPPHRPPRREMSHAR